MYLTSRERTLPPPNPGSQSEDPEEILSWLQLGEGNRDQPEILPQCSPQQRPAFLGKRFSKSLIPVGRRAFLIPAPSSLPVSPKGNVGGSNTTEKTLVKRQLLNKTLRMNQKSTEGCPSPTPYHHSNRAQRKICSIQRIYQKIKISKLKNLTFHLRKLENKSNLNPKKVEK